MVPGKRYAPEDYLRIIWRRKWFVVVPLIVGALGAFLYSRSLPNEYRSEALVLIIPQQVPEKFISPTVGDSIGRRLDLMRRQILSRARLEALIEEFDLYREERKVMLMDQVVELMRAHIGIRVQVVARRESPNHFFVSYDSANPQTAQLVAERLAGLFVRENIEGRTVQSDLTTQFLQRQADEKLRELEAKEAQLNEFRRKYAGQLPTEVTTNLQLMSGARQQIQALTDALARDRERKLSVERTLADEASQPAAIAAPLGLPDAAQANLPAAQQLAAARASLDVLLLRLKEDHPDVRILRGRIRDLERKAEAEALQQPVSAGQAVAAVTPAEAARQKRMAQLRAEIETLERDIQAKQTSLQRAEAALAQQEHRVQAAPGLQAEMADLMRGHDTLRNTYETLLGKLEAAKLATSLEQQEVSQQFRIIDPPRRPDRPRSPDRVRMNVMGALGGLAFGLVLAGLLEYRDTSVRTDEDVLVALSLPVLALVPTMRTETRSRWRGLLPGASAGLIVAVLLAGLAWRTDLLAWWGR